MPGPPAHSLWADAMANATLTSQINSGSTVTSLATTAQPQVANVGEIMYVSLSLTNVEGFVVSAPVAVNDTAVSVQSQQAAQTHLVGEQVAPRYILTTVGRTMIPAPTPRTHRI